MAGTMTNIENNTIRIYWNALRSMSKNIRLGLAVKLTNSVLEEERKEMSLSLIHISEPTRPY